MLNQEEVANAISSLWTVGLLNLEPDEEEIGWEIIRIESMEENHIAYGFRCRYNDLIVGGLPTLELAEAIKKLKMVTSYVEWELERQVY